MTKAKMKTFKGKDYEKERAELLDTLRDLREKRDSSSDEIKIKSAVLENLLANLQTIETQITVDIDDIPTIEANIIKNENSIEDLANEIKTADAKIEKAKKVIAAAEKALDDHEYSRLLDVISSTEEVYEKIKS